MHLFAPFFWIFFSLLFYTFLGYPILIFLINKIRGKKVIITEKFNYLPVTLMIPVYNEEKIIVQKITNSLELIYPKDKLEILFVSDASTDKTDHIIKQYSNIQLLSLKIRRGKANAINEGMKIIKTSIVVFSDANTLLNHNSIVNIMRHYANKNIGGVAGEKKITITTQTLNTGFAEGFYWNYESWIKHQESIFHSTLSAAGELFSIKKKLFIPIPEYIILDDFILSMHLTTLGYKIQYEKNAISCETPSVNLKDEFNRKTRIAAGAFQAIIYISKKLSIYKYPIVLFQYFSRKLLRWFSPLLFTALFFCNLILVFFTLNRFYIYFFYAQLFFYSLSICGIFLINKKKSGWYILPFYFVFMQVCIVTGFIKYIKNKQTALWQKAER